MFLVSFRLRRLPVLVACGVIALAIVFGVFGLRNVLAADDAADTLGRSDRQRLSARTDEERVAFLQSFGWQVESEPLEIIEVIIPEQFDEMYTAYNEMQIAGGFDLAAHAGRRVRRFAYRITNYPGTDEPVRAHLLVYRDRIIGGDICSEVAGSFMHGFEMPQAGTN